MSKLEDIVPPLEMCKEAAGKFPEAWRRDFARREWEQTALCWRTFNRGRKDEYTIVFFTGSLDYESGDVNAPTLAEILAVLPDGMAAVTRRITASRRMTRTRPLPRCGYGSTYRRQKSKFCKQRGYEK